MAQSKKISSKTGTGTAIDDDEMVLSGQRREARARRRLRKRGEFLIKSRNRASGRWDTARSPWPT